MTTQDAAVADSGWAFAARVARLTGSPIDASTSLLQAQRHDVVRLAMGSPAGEAVPAAIFAELLSGLAAEGSRVYDYGPTEGERELRQHLLAFLAARGEPVEPDCLLITAGGMQGLDLACKLFVGAGDLVAVESPTYTNGTATIASYEGTMVEVPVDADGMDVAALEAIVAERGAPPKLVYTIPTFQNPSGASLSLRRRERLVELAAAWGSILLEDDPYGHLRFDGERLPSLRELGRDRAHVIGVHTCSKILAPGLRVGWVVADPAVIAPMVNARHAMDTCTNTLQQLLVARFLAGGHIDEHLVRLRDEYRRRKLELQAALRDELGGRGVSWTDPQGGFFLWLRLPDELDATALFPLALEEGVAFIPGSAFSIGGRFGDALRLAFSAEPPQRAREGVRRLARAIARLQARDRR